MEDVLLKTNSIPGLLAAICVIMSFHVLLRIGEFVWDTIKKKSEVSERSIEKLTVALRLNTESMIKLESRIGEVEKSLSEFSKLKVDLRRLFTAVKTIAGDDWASIRKEMMNGEFDL